MTPSLWKDAEAGFTATARYHDDQDLAIGGRFRHDASGFLVDLLLIRSVHQGFIWVNTFPISDRGEPHTIEHLVLGKGDRGRAVSTQEELRLVRSSAFTSRSNTCYHFHTPAGDSVFFETLEARLEALLHPDFTDEEIRREVCHFGIAGGGVVPLRLEEKGTIYNEMVSTYERASRRLSRTARHVLYGADHPLALDPGGVPSAIRLMRPSHVRSYHQDHYRLSNMGIILSLPPETPPEKTLHRLAEILARAEGCPPPLSAPLMTEDTLPPPAPSLEQQSWDVLYPEENERQHGTLLIQWPANLSLLPLDLLLLGVFLGNIAGDPTTNLYRRLIDARSAELRVGAKSISSGVGGMPGCPVHMTLSDIPQSRLDGATRLEVVALIQDELSRVAAYRPQSDELTSFNGRILNRLRLSRRALARFVNSPPGFGFRGGGSGWLEHLQELERFGTFARPLTYRSQLDALEARVTADGNVWTEYLERWQLTQTAPFLIASRPSAALLRQEKEERLARCQAETLRLLTETGELDAQAALQRFKDDDLAHVQRQEAARAAVPDHPFMDAPPLTLDDGIAYEELTLPGGRPLVASYFEQMTGGTIGLAINIRSASPEERWLFALLPSLLSRVGVVVKGERIPYEAMRERLREEVLGLDAGYSGDVASGRLELVLKGAGSNPEEMVRSITWMKRILLGADFSPENLPRLRDVVDQALGQFRKTMQGREEAWVHGPAQAFWQQEDALLLSARSFLTRTHLVQRLRWRLFEPGPEEVTSQVAASQKQLISALHPGMTRAEAASLLASLEGKARGEGSLVPDQRAQEVLKAMAADLEQNLAEIPETALAQDLTQVCEELLADYQSPPEAVLAALVALRRRVLWRQGHMRVFVIGKRSSVEAVRPALEALITSLPRGAEEEGTRYGRPHIAERVAQRSGRQGPLTFVGLVNDSMTNGVFLNSAPCSSYHDRSEESLLTMLASQLLAGSAAHSAFMKTWSAGLAYSNGLRARPGGGRLSFYAERCPDLVQTLEFVIRLLDEPLPDSGLAPYAMAQLFDHGRHGASYEARGEGLADDLIDGFPPSLISTYRKAILSLREQPGLEALLRKRMKDSYLSVLPGSTSSWQPLDGGVYFVIGPAIQLERYEQWLRGRLSSEVNVTHLYPRDFWIDP